MVGLLVFALVLTLAVLISEAASKSILSTAVVFLLAGFLVGPDLLNLVHIDATDRIVSRLIEFALFSVLFTEGMRVDLERLRSSWSLAGRALLLGMPLTLVMIALLAHGWLSLGWAEALLLGAVLCPTDPVFAEAIVGQERVPERLRHLLNVESGFNDGLALPLVLIFLALASPTEIHAGQLVWEVGGGIVAGVAVPQVVIRLERTKMLAAVQKYKTLLPISIGLLVLGVTSVIGLNELLAAFSAGITIAAIDKEARRDFEQYGEATSELLKLASILVFGALVSWHTLREFSFLAYGFALVTLVAVRPVSLGLALWGTHLKRRELFAALWFGPRGFASVFFSLLVLKSTLESGVRIYHLALLVIAFSMIAHSSTDVLVARWLQRGEEDEAT